MGSRLPWEQESPSSTLGTPIASWGAMFQGGDFALQARCVGFDSLALHQIAAVAEWTRREFPKLVNAGSTPAGSFRLGAHASRVLVLIRRHDAARGLRALPEQRARVAQRKSDTRGEGHMRVQISSRAPKIGDGGMEDRRWGMEDRG